VDISLGSISGCVSSVSDTADDGKGAASCIRRKLPGMGSLHALFSGDAIIGLSIRAPYSTPLRYL